MNEEIKQLEKLLDEEKYEEALKMAEQISSRGGNESQRDMLIIQYVLLRARVSLTKAEESVPAGTAAVQLAAELQEWDYYGAATHFLAVARGMLKQYSSGIELDRAFLEHAHRFTWASGYTAMVWYNLGILYAYDGQHSKVIEPLRRALEAFEASGDIRGAHGVRQALTEQYLRLSCVQEVPRLLAKCGTYLRHHPDAVEYGPSRLYYLQLRMKFAALTGRHHRVRVLATCGINEARLDFYHRRTFHMILAIDASKVGMYAEALKNAVAAQVYSEYVNRKDWEEEAADLIRQNASILGIPIPDVNQYYLGVVGLEEE